jgi:DNA-binding HxlR family transcriptional regulator
VVGGSRPSYIRSVRGYGQFCPVAKAAEILAERWTPLVLRELICGSHRFNDLQRGVPLMSPSMLSARLRGLQRAGVIECRPAQVGRGWEYHLTEAGEELQPIIEQFGVWGQRWARRSVEEGELDAPLLMWDIRRCVRPDDLPDRRVTVEFTFSDVRSAHSHWWLVILKGDADLCLTDPGFEVDVHVTTDLRTMTRVWLGDISVGDAVHTNSMTLTGRTALVRSLPRWIGLSTFARVERPWKAAFGSYTST